MMTHILADVHRITLNVSCMTITGERTKQLDIFCRVTGFTSDFLSFIVMELIRFFHGALHLLECFNTVGWATGKTSNPGIISYQEFPKVLHCNTFWNQIILLGDRGTCVLRTCPGLHSTAGRLGFEPATY